ncbi:MAG: hypothetical protein AAGE52_34820 [Myxococcota bacterium]
MRKVLVRGLFTALVACSTGASAQVIISEGGQPVQQGQPQQGQPVQQGQVVQQQPVQQAPQPFVDQQPQPQPVAQPVEQRLVRQLSGYLSVPFMLTDGALFGSSPSNPADATVGFGLHGRFGWEFGMIVLEAHVGWMIMAVDTDSTIDINLQNIWVGLGGRFQFLNRSRIVPFLSAAFRANFFVESVTGTGTSSSGAYEFEPGVMLGGGIAFELTQNFGLEVAVTGNVVFPAGDTFDELQVFLQPWLGATLYI